MVSPSTPSHVQVKARTEHADDTAVIFARDALRARPTARGLAAAVLAVALTAAAGGTPASAEDAGPARAHARAAAIGVQLLTVQLREMQAGYVGATDAVSRSVSDTVEALTHRDDLAAAQRRAGSQQASTARALYMDGGPAALVSTLLESSDAGDLAGRVVTMRRLMQVAGGTVADADLAHAQAVHLADRAAATADASIVTAAQVAERAAAADVLLQQAQRRLVQLSVRARALEEAEAAARALAAARAEAAARAAATAAAAIPVVAPPADWFELYRAAATTCPGMAWQLLAAVGEVESGHGRNNGPSSAGAIGAMQFMPATFAAYAVDGDGDGVADPWAPADSVYTAARYLCVNGGGSPAGYQRALFAYNHAQWYVDLVLAAMARY